MLYLDNVKEILIFLVVFGHLTSNLNGIFYGIYNFIYLFHMPLFVFCSGYFATLIPNKVIKKILFPYTIFQLLYCLYDATLLGNTLSITLVKPYWIMWYMLSLFFWNCIIILIKSTCLKTTTSTCYALVISIIIGLLSGYNMNIGLTISLSRTIVMFPFLLTGYLLKQNATDISLIKQTRYKFVLYLFTAVILALSLFNLLPLNRNWLYCKTGYDSVFGLIDRGLIYVLNTLISMFVLWVTPTQKTFFTKLGQNSFSVYILHGFIILLLEKYQLFNNTSTFVNIICSLIITSVITGVFSSNLITCIMSRNLLFSKNKLL